MSYSYVIEVGDDQVGLVLRDAGESDYQFHAAHSAYRTLDGRRYASAAQAEKAARAHRAQILAKRGSSQRTQGHVEL
jgi:hypothetical protein